LKSSSGASASLLGSTLSLGWEAMARHSSLAEGWVRACLPETQLPRLDMAQQMVAESASNATLKCQ